MKASLIRFIKEAHYRVYSCLNTIVPKDKKLIFIYDNLLMKQNCWAFFRYLTEHGYNEAYKIVYYTKSPQACVQFAEEKNIVIEKDVLKGWWQHLRASYIFFEYDNYKFAVRPARGQICFNFWHGMPIKNIAYLANEKPPHPYEQDISFLLSSAEFFVPIMKKAFGCSDDQMYVGGPPRNDQLLSNVPKSKLLRADRLNVLWMPTFRKSASNNFNDSSVSIPIVRAENVEKLDAYLREKNVDLLIKLHPFQDRIDWLCNESFTNIRTLTNQDIFESGVELYEFVGQTDALITDYSSILFDYLLTNKPMAFVMDDYAEYGQKRGFIFDDFVSMLPGPIVNTYDEFVSVIASLKEDDMYSERRLRLRNELMPLSRSGSFSKDIIDFLKISV